jgi:hypothetical protein
MSNTNESRTRRIIARTAQIWAEMDYAQRRLLEIRTGIPGLTREERVQGVNAAANRAPIEKGRPRRWQRRVTF